jgi:hypothetical protein
MRAVLALALLGAGCPYGQALLPAAAQEPAPPPVKEAVVVKISLSHQPANAMMDLLLFEKPQPGRRSEPKEPGPGKLAQGAAGRTSENLLPKEIDGIILFPQANSLLVRGSREATGALEAAVPVLDVPHDYLARDRVRAVVKPKRGTPAQVKAEIEKLPEGGKVTVEEKSVVLEGSPAWLHRALRALFVIEAQPPVSREAV